ncbi:putative NBD/HSP70 family sugar kinase [Haloactinospora alba]|uniref:Putative NBD/HSP70 family sugar kinase n=1 Tax=Haloactinospora alba TaxID=405555 RepID=A0A543NIM7_9ACTN|nr:ROK family transcriptional regulator [Haloactinospora alba]TQN31686.1 putative NBD/HSP70 family sugar kinase [Haloactinospora alba]
MSRSKAFPSAAFSNGHVLELIRTGKATTRTELGRVTGLSRPAVALRVGELVAHGLVLEETTAPSNGGRPPSQLQFNSSGGVILTAALGISRSQVAVCDLSGRVLAQENGSPHVEHGPTAALEWVMDSWESLIGKTGHTVHDVYGTGISVPATVEFAVARTQNPPVLANWSDVAVEPQVAERFPGPVLLDNDVNVMALAEHRSLHGAPDADDMIVVKASTGIGAGIISGGALVRGSLGAAGELGHIPVRTSSTRPCRCGNTDCLETVAGGAALVEHLAAHPTNAETVHEVAELAHGGDPQATYAVRTAGRHLGEVLAGAVNLLNPAVITLGGDLAYAYDPLVAGVREVIFRRSTALATRQLRIVGSELGEQAGLLGCAVMVLDHILSPEAVNAMIASQTSR